MTYIKAELGLTALKDRHAVALSRGQRSALILFDGIRSAGAVLAATGALGVSKADIDTLVSQGLLQAAPDSKPEAARPPQDAPQTDFASSTLAAHYADMELPVAPNTRGAHAPLPEGLPPGDADQGQARSARIPPHPGG